MKGLFKRIVGSLLLLLLAFFLVYKWISYDQKAAKVVFLHTNPTAFAMNYQAVADDLISQKMDVTVSSTENWETDAASALSNGADVLVLGIDTLPQNTNLLEQASEVQASLFFVGVYPGDDYLAAYDKAYYVGSRACFAGELAGQQMANLFGSEKLVDANQNLLLDYLVATDDSDLNLFQQALIECEHYGVYLQNCLPQTVAAPSDADENHIPHWTDCPTQPEVLLCSSFSSLQSAIAWADEKGWQDITYVSFVNSMEQAQQAQQAGSDITIFYDAESISSTIFSLITHLIQQESLTEGLSFAPDSYGAIWIPYQTFGSLS